MFILLYAFSLLGVLAFKGAFYYRCRFDPMPSGDVWPIDRSVTRFCSDNGQGNFNCPSNRYCGHPDMYDIPLSTENMSEMAESFYGQVSYDDIGSALLINYQVMVGENWAEYFFRIMDTRYYIVGQIYFLLFIFIIYFLGVNFVVSVIVDSFLNNAHNMLDDKKEKSNSDNEREKLQDLQDSLSPSIILGQDSEDLTPVRAVGESRMSLMKPSLFAIEAARQNAEKVENLNKLRRSSTFHLQKSDDQEISNPTSGSIPIKQTETSLGMRIFDFSLIFLNLVVLACYGGFNEENEIKILDYLNCTCVVLFWLEMVVKVIIRGRKEFVQDVSNILDLMVDGLGVVDILLSYPIKLTSNILFNILFRRANGDGVSYKDYIDGIAFPKGIEVFL